MILVKSRRAILTGYENLKGFLVPWFNIFHFSRSCTKWKNTLFLYYNKCNALQDYTKSGKSLHDLESVEKIEYGLKVNRSHVMMVNASNKES